MFIWSHLCFRLLQPPSPPTWHPAPRPPLRSGSVLATNTEAGTASLLPWLTSAQGRLAMDLVQPHWGSALPQAHREMHYEMTKCRRKKHGENPLWVGLKGL